MARSQKQSEVKTQFSSVVGYVPEADNVKTRYQETTSEDSEVFMCTVVTVILECVTW
jgi:hypothetical protein